MYGGLLSVLDLVELVPVIDVGGSDTGRVRETTPAKRHRQVGVRVVPFHPPRPAGGVSGPSDCREIMPLAVVLTAVVHVR